MRDDIRKAMDAAKAVQKLSTEAKDLLLMGLIGRMIVTDPERVLEDIEEAQRLDAELAG